MRTKSSRNVAVGREQIRGHDLARVIGEEGSATFALRPSRSARLLELRQCEVRPRVGSRWTSRESRRGHRLALLVAPCDAGSYTSRTGESRDDARRVRSLAARYGVPRQPCHRCDSQAHSTRSRVVKRSRGRRERFAVVNWWRSARISRCGSLCDGTRARRARVENRAGHRAAPSLMSLRRPSPCPSCNTSGVPMRRWFAAIPKNGSTSFQ